MLNVKYIKQKIHQLTCSFVYFIINPFMWDTVVISPFEKLHLNHNNANPQCIHTLHVRHPRMDNRRRMANQYSYLMCLLSLFIIALFNWLFIIIIVMMFVIVTIKLIFFCFFLFWCSSSINDVTHNSTKKENPIILLKLLNSFSFLRKFNYCIRWLIFLPFEFCSICLNK